MNIKTGHRVLHGVLFLVFLLFSWTFFLKRKESLPEIIEESEQNHTDEHGGILLERYCEAFKQMTHKGLCYAVGDKIANGNVYNKSDDYVPVTLFIFECIVFIQEVAQDASKEVIGC